MKKPGIWILALALARCAPAQTSRPLRADATPSSVASPELAAVKRNLSVLIDAGKLTDLRWHSFPDYRNQLRDFYQPSDYALAWVNGNQPTDQARAMIQLLQNADKKGLRPEDYDASRWTDRMARLAQSTPQGTAEDSVRFDLALTVSAMRYISDLHSGRINPKYFDYGLHVNRRAYKIADFLRNQVVNAKDVGSVL
ncbi:MAG TPA: hypothetical protein VJA94_12530, partial [Candidatus Angelobacter sp.]